MRFIKSLIILGAIESAVAHTVFTTLYVDGVSQGDGTCVRMNTTPDEATYPVEDLTSNDMACGITGEIGVSRVCAANQSSTLTFQFLQYPDGSETSVIADSHLGPCAVYLKQVSSAIDDPGYGDGWFKIWESGYDEDTEEWCVTKLINAGGLLSVDLPSDIAGGSYLVRPELLALHKANSGDPQFFTGCAQVFLNSDATSIPTETVAIPGYVAKDDPSVNYDIYTTPLALPYPIPGPEIYENSEASNIVGKRASMKQTEGLKPEGCILEVANWFGIELDTYSTMDGCWNASSACWTQNTACWADTDPTGGARLCPIWEDHCTSIESACNAGESDGPPNAGTDLQPAPSTIDLIMVSPSGATSVMASATSAAPSVIDSTTAIVTSAMASSTTSVASSIVDSTTNIATSVIATSVTSADSSVVESTTTIDMSDMSSSASSVASSIVDSTTSIATSAMDITTNAVSLPVDIATYTTSTLSTTSYGQSAPQSTETDTLATLSPDSSAGSIVKALFTESQTPQASTQAPLAHAVSTSLVTIASAKTSSITTSSPTTFTVTKSSTTTSSSAEKTVTVTEFYCPAETGLSGKETRKLIRHQEVHERRKAALEKKKKQELSK